MKTFRTLLTFSFALVLCFSVTVFADSNPSSGTTLYNLSENPPADLEDGVEIYDSTKPPKSKIWNITSKGKYSFSGSATGSSLYTNYWITGKTKYTVYTINNHSSKPLKITPISSTGGIFKGTTVPAGARQQYTFSVNKTSEKIYLKFSAPNNFDGYIK